MVQPIDQESFGKTTASFIPIALTEVALAILCWSASALVGDCPGHMDSFSESIATLPLKDLAVYTIPNLSSVSPNLLSNQSSQAESNQGKLRIILTLNSNPNKKDLNALKNLIIKNFHMNIGMYKMNIHFITHVLILDPVDSG